VDNVVEPALQRLSADQLENTASRDVFFEQLKKLLGDVVELLQEQPVIVAHTENTFDGSGVRRLLANKFELDKVHDQIGIRWLLDIFYRVVVDGSSDGV
jgi:hypothetical protein